MGNALVNFELFFKSVYKSWLTITICTVGFARIFWQLARSVRVKLSRTTPDASRFSKLLILLSQLHTSANKKMTIEMSIMYYQIQRTPNATDYSA